MLNKVVAEKLESSGIELVDQKENNVGINGLGRIGKASARYHIKRILRGESNYTGVDINLGRVVGLSPKDNLLSIINTFVFDSTFGPLWKDLGISPFKKYITPREIQGNMRILDIEGVKVRFGFTHRNPKAIPWNAKGVNVVLDTTGAFKDPSLDPYFEDDDPKNLGVVQGHLIGGAKYVVVSAPFKAKNEMPINATTLVAGINDNEVKLDVHQIFSTASCTTTCLTHMLKPIIDKYGVEKIISVKVNTIHGVTNSQELLDTVPKANATDLRKSRAALDNIIFTSTGAAKATKIVMPSLKDIPFDAFATRIPTKGPSTIVLYVELAGDYTVDDINGVYKEASNNAEIFGTGPNEYKLGAHYNPLQATAIDILGFPAPAVIEGEQTTVIKKPGVTEAKIIGWYDNEMGSYTNTANRFVDWLGSKI